MKLKILSTIKNRFVINPVTEQMLLKRGIGVYIPKIKKLRLTFGLLGVLILVAVPFVTPLAIFPLMWVLK